MSGTLYLYISSNLGKPWNLAELRPSPSAFQNTGHISRISRPSSFY